MADIADSITNIAQNTGQGLQSMAQRSAPAQYSSDFTNYTDELRAANAFQQTAMPVIAATAGIFQRGQQIQQAEQSLQLQSMAERTRQSLAQNQIYQTQLGLDDVQKLGDFQTKVAAIPVDAPNRISLMEGLLGNSGIRTFPGLQQGKAIIAQAQTADHLAAAQAETNTYHNNLIRLQTDRLAGTNELLDQIGTYGLDPEDFQSATDNGQPGGLDRATARQAIDQEYQKRYQEGKAAAEAAAKPGTFLKDFQLDKKTLVPKAVYSSSPVGGKGGAGGINGPLDVSMRSSEKDYQKALSNRTLFEEQPDLYWSAVDAAAEGYNSLFTQRGVKPSGTFELKPDSTERIFSEALKNPGSEPGMFGSSGIDDGTVAQMALNRLPDDQKAAFENGSLKQRKAILTKQVQFQEKARKAKSNSLKTVSTSELASTKAPSAEETASNFEALGVDPSTVNTESPVIPIPNATYTGEVDVDSLLKKLPALYSKNPTVLQWGQEAQDAIDKGAPKDKVIKLLNSKITDLNPEE